MERVMSNHMSAEERAKYICSGLSENIVIGGTDYLTILDGIKQAMRDQRHACCEALLPFDVPQETHTAVFNAHVRPSGVGMG